jgi:hypothetical protein
MNDAAIIYIFTEWNKTKQDMNNIKTPKIYITNENLQVQVLQSFSTSLHVGRIPFAKSMRFLHFSLMLN